MAKRSGALLVYRIGPGGLEVLIAHMGGPLWARKQEHAWSIPKGEYAEGEDSLAAARREFEEEMGSAPPGGELLALGECRQPSGKIITTYAVRGEFDIAGFRSNTFTMEWPRGSGQFGEFPEVDRAEWAATGRAARLLVNGQLPILAALRERLLAAGHAAAELDGPGAASAEGAGDAGRERPRL